MRTKINRHIGGSAGARDDVDLAGEATQQEVERIVALHAESWGRKLCASDGTATNVVSNLDQQQRVLPACIQSGIGRRGEAHIVYPR
ncbi:hypothetical protein D3C81_1742290 [compost metagenome]